MVPETMPTMGSISRGIDKIFDKLPTWAQVICWVLMVALTVYGIAQYGWSFLLKAIFSPL